MTNEQDFIQSDNKKYHLDLNSKIEWDGRTLYRIVADKEFENGATGELILKNDSGGYIESTKNLSQEDTCWISGDARVFDSAEVHGDAMIEGNAKIFENASVAGHAIVVNCANVYGSAYIYGNAVIDEYAQVSGISYIYDNAKVKGNAYIYGSTIKCDACVCGSANVADGSYITDNAVIFMNATVGDRAVISGRAIIYGNAGVHGATVTDNARVFDCAEVCCGASLRGNAIVCQEQKVNYGIVSTDLSLFGNLSASIKAQTGLVVENNKIIAYKRVRPDLSSFHDENFKYVVGEYAEADVDAKDISNESCAPGLHFSYSTYWDRNVAITNSVLLKAEIDLNDVITVQQGKIRCKRAKILSIAEE